MNTSALFTDFYELTMAQGYWKHGLDTEAVFDMFFRRHPFHGGFSVFAGLDPLLAILESIRFHQDDLAWLESQGIFETGFLRYLEDFRFKGDIWSVDEGETIFPQVPLLRIHAGLVEAQIIEGLVLNTINFQSLIATKSSRVSMAARNGAVMEFGLRRAQGFNGAMSASRASFIGGSAATSNALAAKDLGIPAMGTMAHSWVMAFPSEREAFEAYADMYPKGTTLLIDTYDTLASGLWNAIAVGRRLAEQGRSIGIRLDSGDIDYLSRKVREALDKNGLENATIVVSNELDEEIIERLVSEAAPVDVWGVGTHLVTGGKEASFSGVYKLAAVKRDGSMEATMKFSDNPEKTTNPGVKEAYRLFDENGMAIADVLALSDEKIEMGVMKTFYHPSLDPRRFSFASCREPKRLLERVMAGGKRLRPPLALEVIRERRAASLASFDHTFLRFLNPHVYKVSVTEELRKLKLGFVERFRGVNPAS
ncbi:MAG: nicotinate phosphoribosyltransferase [Spirochaetales bacterium]|nr:MAG: nicotinate phosphoribosyltransferase [Spirochaetales bacterium]